MLKAAIGAAFLIIATTAQAATPSCYRPEEIEADQAIRFQTELMVRSEVCRDRSYVEFTQHNRDAIIAYQHALIGHYRRIGDRHAQETLDDYMTRLANELALTDGEQSAQALCAKVAPLLHQASELRSAEFRRIAAERAADKRSAYRHCRD